MPSAGRGGGVVRERDNSGSEERGQQSIYEGSKRLGSPVAGGINPSCLGVVG